MPHLKRDSATGHLLHSTDGHLVHECDEGTFCYLLTPCSCKCCLGGDCCYSPESIITGDFLVPVISDAADDEVADAWKVGYELQGDLMGETYNSVQMEMIACSEVDHGTTWWAMLDSYSYYFASFYGQECSGTYYLHVFVRKITGLGWFAWFAIGPSATDWSTAVAVTDSDATVLGTCCAVDGDIDASHANIFETDVTAGTFDVTVSENYCCGTEGGTPACGRAATDTCAGAGDGICPESVVPLHVDNDLAAYDGDCISITDANDVELCFTVEATSDCVDADTLSAGMVASITRHDDCEDCCDDIGEGT